jgi:uncharacterized membrane protein YgcG
LLSNLFFKIPKMSARFALLSIFTFCSFITSAQTRKVIAHIIDAADNSALSGVTGILVSSADTTKKTGNVTDAYGNLEIDDIAPGRYTLRIVYLGYTPVSVNITMDDTEIALGDIKLHTAAHELKSVTIEGKQIRGQQLGDTSQFNANAYKTHPDATAEDLVSKMPGITSDNTGVKSNGENIQQVYVDGKPFFGTDPTLALKNLPAEVIDKIQVFDKLSDQSTFTGFDDGNTTKTMNIITRRNKSEGVFGKVYAGYGTDDRYTAGGNINFFNGDRRISLIGLANNINQQNFSSQDILGITGGNQSRGGFGGGGSRGSFGGGGGNASSNFLVGQQNGITTTNSAGFNYSDVWAKKIKITGSYFYNGTDNVNSTELVRNYFTRQDTGQVYHENDNSEAKNYNHRINLRFEYNMDSFNSIIFTPGISFQRNNSGAAQSASTDSLNNTLSSTHNTNAANNTGYSSSNNLLVQHKFKKPRRTVSLNVNSSLNEKSGDGVYHADNSIFNYDGLITRKDSVIDQRYMLYNHGYTLGGNITYTEPVGSKGQVMANYYPSVSKSSSDKETFDDRTGAGNNYTLDTALSNKYNTTYLTQRGGLSYRIGDRKLSFMAGANMQYATLDGTRTFPNAFNLQKNFTDVLPTAMFNYRFSDGRNLRIMYRTNTTAPAVTQLQDAVDITNPLLLKTGNPSLREDYENTFIFRYGSTRSKAAHNLFLFAYANYINNYIGNANYMPKHDSTFNGPGFSNPVFIPRGSQLSLPVNLNGYFNGRSFITYGMPADFMKSNLNFNGGFSYTRSPGKVNDALNYSLNYVPSLGIVISSNISEKLDFTLSYTGNYNIVKNTIQTAANNNYYSHTGAFKVNYIFLEHFVFNTNITHNYYTAFSSTGDQSFFLWNAYLGYKFLKKDALEIRVSAYDILNQNKSINRTVTDLYVENSTTQVLKQYFLLQLTYTIRNFKGAPVNMPTDKGEEHGMRPWGEHTH